MKKFTLLYLAVYLLIFCLANTANADDAVYNGDGIDVYPLENADIQMVAEVITVSDKGGKDRFEVDVDMTFKNHGDSTTVQLGFPILTDWVEGERIEFDPHLRTWVNGKKVEIIKKRGVPNPLSKVPDPSDAVYTYSVTFGKNETVKIGHHYAVGGTFYSEGSWRFVYILRTGALWKDVIESMKIVYKTKSSSVHEIKCTNPPNPVIEQHGEETYFTWNLANIKPKGDFIIEGNVRRQPTANKEAILETCIDFSQIELKQTLKSKSRVYGFGHFHYYPNPLQDGTGEFSIGLFSKVYVIENFQPKIFFSTWFVVMLLCGSLSYKNAINKNRNKVFWLILGALTAPWTILYIYFITKKK